MSVGCIIQARMGSTRLPDKVTMPLYDGDESSIIARIIIPLKKQFGANNIVLATSNQPADDALEEQAIKLGVGAWRGSENDVLSRYCEAAEHYDFTTVVRLTGDNPFVDPAYITQAVEDHLAKKVDYTYTRGLPLGMNVEVVERSALNKAQLQGKTSADREHVTKFIRDNPAIFRLNFLDIDLAEPITNLRLTVDTAADLTLAKIIFTLLAGKYTGLKDIITIFQKMPHLFLINCEVQQKRQFKSVAEEIDAAIELLQQQDLIQAAELLIQQKRINESL